MSSDSIRDRRDVAERLALLVRAVGAKSKDVADKCGVRVGAWSTYMTARSDLPLSVARELKRVYGCSVDWLIVGEEDHNSPAFQKLLDQVRKQKTSGPPLGRPRKRS